ncbi:MAG: sulfurtransferase [Lachnospirales bacterium]
MKKNLFKILVTSSLSLFLLGSCGSSKADETSENVPSETPTETSLEVTSEDSEAEKVSADTVETQTVYVSPRWVQSVINGEVEESKDYVILECSWGEESDSPNYKSGHIQGSYHMNTDYIEEEKLWNVRTPEEVEKVLVDYGITKDTTLITYGSNASDSADDRVAFVALWAGVENVKSINGGLEAWTNAGFELEMDGNIPVATESFGVDVPAHPEYIMTMEESKNRLENDNNFKLVSIRSEKEFLGEASGYSYIDKAGEPKGAIWGRDTDDGSYTDGNGKMASIDVLENYLRESDATFDNDLAFYCGTGWRASIPFLMCYEKGMKNISLYDGGWYQWLIDATNPVQLGDPSSDEVIYTTVGELEVQ